MQLEGGYLARELALDVASYEEIQAALPEDTTLIEYGLSDDGSYVFIITSDAIDGYVLDVDYLSLIHI